MVILLLIVKKLLRYFTLLIPLPRKLIDTTLLLLIFTVKAGISFSHTRHNIHHSRTLITLALIVFLEHITIILTLRENSHLIALSVILKLKKDRVE